MDKSGTTNGKIDIVIVIENKIQGEYIDSFFDKEKYTVTKFFDGKQAFDYILESNNMAAVNIVSYQLPGLSGVELMKQIRERYLDFAFIFITSDTTVERAVEAMKTGAIDFIPKSSHLQEDLPPMVLKAHKIQLAKIEQQHIKKELEEKNRELIKLSIVARETDNAVAIFDEHGNLEWINEGYTRLTGYTLHEIYDLLGRNVIEISNNESIKKIVQECIDSKFPTSYTTECATKSKDMIWIRTTLTPIVDENGNFLKLIAIDSDITDVKLAEQEILKQKQNITNSIIYGERIQKALLPLDEILKENLSDYFVLFKPRDIVSGDFFWSFKTEKQFIIAAADCTGHGVPGAFMSMLGMTGLNQIVQSEVNTGKEIKAFEILNKLKHYIVKSLHQTGKAGETADGMDLALCIIDHENKKVQFAGANNPLLLIRNNEIIKYDADKMPIGIYRKCSETFTNNEFQYLEGDIFYIFSDGFIDQFGGEEKRKFMSKRFQELLLKIHKYPMSEQKEELNKAFNDWKGDNKQTDDILVIGFIP